MKTYIFTIALLLSASIQAAPHINDCVFPKTKHVTGNRLVLAGTVYIYETSSIKSSKHPLKEMMSYTVDKKAAGGFIHLVTVPDSDSPPAGDSVGTSVGWGLASNFDIQALRNCN